MNMEMFTGKAEVYAKARPGYPNAAIDYIVGLVPSDAVFADVSAGSGKYPSINAIEELPDLLESEEFYND